MQLEGMLGQFSLRELIEMIVYSSVTGVLEMRVGDEVGQIFFRDGLPYHAAVNRQVGFDAACLMFEERETPFRFVAGGVASEETLWLDPWDLIERAEDQAKQWQRVRPRIPSLNWVPALCMAPLDVCVALVSLLDQGLITIKQPRPTPLTPRPVAPSGSGNFFERLIAAIPTEENDPANVTAVDTEDGPALRSRARRE